MLHSWRLKRPARTVVDGGRRDGDPARLVADISRIRREVGWQPKTELREGLLRTIGFYESHRHLWLSLSTAQT
jgi:nucleoside-diphosphate-sugar epimerase